MQHTKWPSPDLGKRRSVEFADINLSIPAPESASFRCFISYCWLDRARVEPVFDAISRAGFDPWMDRRTLRPGEFWIPEIAKTISESDVFFAFLSDISVSRMGYAQTEIQIALEIDKIKPQPNFIVPVLLDKCELPVNLSDRNAVRYFDQPDGHLQLMHDLRIRKHQKRERLGPQLVANGSTSGIE